MGRYDAGCAYYCGDLCVGGGCWEVMVFGMGFRRGCFGGACWLDFCCVDGLMGLRSSRAFYLCSSSGWICVRAV